MSKKIDEELLPAVWHLTRVWDWCMPVDLKKEIGRLVVCFYSLNLTIKLDHCK